MKRSIFCDHSIKKIVSEYKNKRLSPVEVAQRTIEYIEQNEPIYHVWTCFDADKLVKQAKKSEERILRGDEIRPLEGIPVGVKDIMNTTDFPTQMGSEIWKDFTPGNDARVVYNVKRSGAVIPGKTATAEFAVHSLGKTINPHHQARTPGTSSTGSAVAIATGMVPMSLGTQTAGSIVRPASFCGIYGVKPSYGLIPRTGILKTTDVLDTVGFFSYHVEDIETILASLIVRGQNYPMSNQALSDSQRQSLNVNKSVKIGVMFAHTWQYATSYAQQAFLDWVHTLGACKNFIVEEVPHQDLLSDTHAVHDIIYNKSLAYYFQEEFQHDELISPIMKDMISKGLKVSTDEYKKALIRQEELVDMVDDFFQEYDFIVSLSTAGHAPMRTEVEKPDTALLWTMTYVPVVSAPVFISPEKLPFGVQVVCRQYNDFKLLKFVQNLASIGLIPQKVNPSIFENVSKTKNDSLVFQAEV
jgi:Asp-tRNA(Asn)/Glu-tRNA(Gln) amidotransferase A subunit family amidase